MRKTSQIGGAPEDRSSRAMVHLTRETRDLLRRIRHGEGRLWLLLDDTGCCGAGNVFLQKRAPGEPYSHLATFPGLTVWIHRSFRGAREGEEFLIDATPSVHDDSFSLETRYGHRFTLTLSRRGPRAAATT